MAAARLEAHHLGRWSRYVGSSPAGKRIVRCGAGFKPEAVDRATEGNASNMLPLDAEKAVPVVTTASNLFSRPPQRKRSEWGRASGSERGSGPPVVLNPGAEQSPLGIDVIPRETDFLFLRLRERLEENLHHRFGACLHSRGRGRAFRPEGMNGPPDCRERGERRGGSEKRMAGNRRYGGRGVMSVHRDGELGCEAACLPDVEARGGFAADDTPAASLRTSL